MEIFSFFEPQNQVVKPVHPNNKKKARVAISGEKYRHSYYTYTSSYANDFLSAQTAAAIPQKKEFDLSAFTTSIAETISIDYKKIAIIIAAVVTAVLCILAGAAIYSRIVDSICTAAELGITAERDIALLDESMRNFVLSRNTGETFDENGNIVTDETMLPELFTEAVSFSSYSVKPNDNITSITKKAGLRNISTLIAVNNITNVRRLQAGQKMIIPSMDGMFYTVQKNDTLETISSKFELSLEKLLDVNDLATSTLTEGEKLFIPGAKLSSNELKKALGELFVSPLTVSWRLTSKFGYRPDPFTGVKSYHTGIDMAAPQKTPIKASADGKVSVCGYSPVYGNYVIITHDNGYQTLYAHMYAATVKKGQFVTQGTKIGLLGSTGYSTGPHLHFSVYKNGKLINPFEVLK